VSSELEEEGGREDVVVKTWRILNLRFLRPLMSDDVARDEDHLFLDQWAEKAQCIAKNLGESDKMDRLSVGDVAVSLERALGCSFSERGSAGIDPASLPVSTAEEAWLGLGREARVLVDELVQYSPWSVVERTAAAVREDSFGLEDITALVRSFGPRYDPVVSMRAPFDLVVCPCWLNKHRCVDCDLSCPFAPSASTLYGLVVEMHEEEQEARVSDTVRREAFCEHMNVLIQRWWLETYALCCETDEQECFVAMYLDLVIVCIVLRWSWAKRGREHGSGVLWLVYLRALCDQLPGSDVNLVLLETS
jgi:hypothetical protein